MFCPDVIQIEGCRSRLVREALLIKVQKVIGLKFGKFGQTAKWVSFSNLMRMRWGKVRDGTCISNVVPK